MMQRPIVMELYDGPMPTPRERQDSWLRYCFALIANLPIDHVSVVHNDERETITVHLVCPNACRCVMTLMMQIGSDDDCYDFVSNSGLRVKLPLEPHCGEE